MRDFEQIRQQNRRKDMFFTGMEEKPVELPPEAIKKMKDFFENHIKPTRNRVFQRQIEKGNL
ncbi:hypothetical protein [Desulfosporosinus shakirovi]|uniref:hypothetical protein n=1 Tax=Desulfosporosinus shakirovi TaxID=2885154 RepID=UPI001E51C5F2|nr:hypothetical protein [Desulfosporosinus sp. SRJS8]MCB8817354.1 hypothetical protein [Desulfosporosinus sp. SRJS8]